MRSRRRKCRTRKRRNRTRRRGRGESLLPWGDACGWMSSSFPFKSSNLWNKKKKEWWGKVGAIKNENVENIKSYSLRHLGFCLFSDSGNDKRKSIRVSKTIQTSSKNVIIYAHRHVYVCHLKLQDLFRASYTQHQLTSGINLWPLTPVTGP